MSVVDELRADISKAFPPKIEALPYQFMQPNFVRLIDNLASCYQVSSDLIVGSLFAATSAAVGKRLAIDDGRYINNSCLWLALVGRSGINKSQPLAKLLEPIQLIDAEAYRTYKAAIKEWKLQTSAGNTTDKPTFQQHVISDSTPESRYNLLELNDLLLYSDELRTFFDNVNRYSKSGEVSQLLSIFDGRQLVINRIGAEPLLIERPFLSIVGTVQPTILPQVLGNPQFTDSGFIQRFLFVYPTNQDVCDYTDGQPDTELLEKWNRFVCNKLLNLPPTTLQLSPEGKAAYIDYYNDLQEIKRNSDDYTASVCSKLQIYCERLAIIIHVLMGVSPCVVGSDEMKMSIECCRYFQGTAEKVKKLIAGNSGMTDKEIIQLVGRRWPTFNQSAFAQAIGVSQQYVNNVLKR